MNNCNLTTCRYNADGKCTNDEKREECVEVTEKVLADRLSRFEDDGKWFVSEKFDKFSN